MDGPIVESRFLVHGVRSETDVRRATQALFDIFADQHIGQASFEISGDGPAVLILKHAANTAIDREAIAKVLLTAGAYRLR